jgi:hypothetical protein
MSILTSTWHELVRRRLWPVALLLLAAIAAVPLLLAKDPEPAPPAPVANNSDNSAAAAAAATAPVVSLVDDADAAKRRRVLGARKNPFEPAPVKIVAAKTTTAKSTTTTTTTSGSSSSGADTGGSSAPSGGSSTPPASTPPASTPPAPKPTYELYSLTVRFGASDEPSLPKMNLPRLKALPSAEDPVLLYLGLAKDNKTAVFMVDSNVEPQGDGTCDPSPANCETIRLRVGDTEFFDVKDEKGEVTAQYELDLLAVKTHTTSSASAAAAARAKVSGAGRKVLRVRKAQRGPLRWTYDAKSGTVHRLDRKAYKAAVAKTARIALAFSGGF